MLKRIKSFAHSPDYSAWLISTGMVLFVIHNRAQPLINYIFLPQVGVALIMFGLLEAYEDSKKLKQKLTLGSKWVYIPMLVIIASCWLRVPFYRFQTSDIAGGLFFTTCFGLYIISRVLKEKVFIAFLPALLIEAISTIVQGLAYPGLYSGGIITSPPDPIKWANYELASGFLFFGFLVYQGKYKWELGTLVIVALFFTGAPEAIFLSGLLVLSIIIRKDWNWRKVGITSAIILPVMLSWYLLGYARPLWDRTYLAVHTLSEPADRIIVTTPDTTTKWIILNPIWARWVGYENTIETLAPLGHGVQIIGNNALTAHNVPLIIVDQIGVAAGVAWLVASVYLLIHSKHRYLWIIFIGMGAIDHYTWDNAAVWWWAIAGASMVDNINNDYILKTDE